MSESETQASKKNDNVLHKMLFPMKRNDYSLSERKHRHSPQTHTQSLCPEQKNESDGKGSALQWIGLTPLEMVETLARMTGKCLDLSSRRSVKPLLVDTDFLASHTPSFQPPPPAVHRMYLAPKNEGNKVFDILNQDSGECRQEISEMNVDGQLSGQKRARTHPEEEDISEVHSCSSNKSTLPFSLLWDESPINFEEFSNAPHDVTKLNHLTKQFEATSSCRNFMPSYIRIYEYFVMTLKYIQSLDETSYMKQCQINSLYSTSAEKMVALLQMALAMDEESRDTFHSQTQSPPKSNSKKDFAEYMNNWLRENWTNPYPDDEGLLHIANVCGTNPTVVSNWLINARTRKWRPAIAKAYEMGRPADLLKEDAICIFDGKPLRELR